MALAGAGPLPFRGPSWGRPAPLRRRLLMLAGVEQVLAPGVGNGLHPRVQVQLLEDVADVVFYRVLRDEEVLGISLLLLDWAMRPQDLHLAVGKAGWGRALRARRPAWPAP